MSVDRTPEVLLEVLQERERQEAKWGEQNHPSGTSEVAYALQAAEQKRQVDDTAKLGRLTYLDILLEEVYEAAAEQRPAKLRTELVQVAAVAVAWIECIDRRSRLENDVATALGCEVLDGRTGERLTIAEAAARAALANRDPRKDPLPGDVLVLPPREGMVAVPIHVVHRRDEVVYFATARTPISTIYLTEWQVQMVSAGVLDDEDKAWPLPPASREVARA